MGDHEEDTHEEEFGGEDQDHDHDHDHDHGHEHEHEHEEEEKEREFIESEHQQARSWNGTTVKDVPANDFIVKYAQHLKRSGQITLPKWVDLVKTSTRKELAPYDPDWFYIRTASIARQIYIKPGLGVGALARHFGGRKRRGVRRRHFSKASTGIIRRALKELEKIKVVQKVDEGKGRKITAKGQRDLDRIAGQITVIPKPI